MPWRAEGIRACITRGMRRLSSKELKEGSVNMLLNIFFLRCTRASREDCQNETEGWPNAMFKKFSVEKQAWDFVKEHCPNMKLIAGSSPAKQPPRNTDTSSCPTYKVAILERLQKIENQIQEFHENIMLDINALKMECLFPPASAPKKITLIDIEDAPPPFSQSMMSCTSGESENPAKKIKLAQSTTYGSTNSFRVDAEGYVEVYTDGACTKNGFNGAKAGVGVWFGDGHSLNISEPVKRRITNNSAEIEAATAAIEAAHRAGVKKLKVYTDSTFLISSITGWIKKWKRNGWKTATGEPVKNKEELILLDDARKRLNVTFVHVKGHAGIYENEQADALARAGAVKCAPSKLF